MNLDTLPQVQTVRGVLDLASGRATREMHVRLPERKRRGVKGGKKNETMLARMRGLQARVEALEGEMDTWTQQRGGLETRLQDLGARVERERDGAGARITFVLESEQWEKERVALLDWCVWAEQVCNEARLSEAELS